MFAVVRRQFYQIKHFNYSANRYCDHVVVSCVSISVRNIYSSDRQSTSEQVPSIFDHVLLCELPRGIKKFSTPMIVIQWLKKHHPDPQFCLSKNEASGKLSNNSLSSKYYFDNYMAGSKNSILFPMEFRSFVYSAEQLFFSRHTPASIYAKRHILHHYYNQLVISTVCTAVDRLFFTYKQFQSLMLYDNVINPLILTLRFESSMKKLKFEILSS